MLKSTKDFCKNNPNILFTKADKGNVTEALNKEVYLEKIKELLNDNNTYSVVIRNQTSKIEKTLNNLLKNCASIVTELANIPRVIHDSEYFDCNDIIDCELTALFFGL